MNRLITIIRSKMKNQVFFYLILLTIVLSVLIFGIMQNYIKSNFYALAEENYLYRVQFQRDLIDNYIEDKERILSAFVRQVEWGAGRLFESEQNLADWKESTNVIEALQFFKENNELNFEQVFLVTPDLDMYTYSVYYDLNLPVRATQEQFNLVLDRNRIGMSEPRISRFSDKPVTIIADMVRYDDQVLAVMGATIYLEKFNDFFVTQTRELEGTTYVMYQDRYLLHPDKEQILSEHSFTLPAFSSNQGFFSIENVNCDNNYNYFYARSEKFPEAWVISTICSGKLYQQVDNYLTILMVLLLLALIVVIFSSYLMALRFTKPVIYLKEVMDQATQGDFFARAEVSSEDELGQAMKSFNFLMNRITDLTFYDKLTGLPNYMQFKYWFQKNYADQRDENNLVQKTNDFSLVLISINGFKVVNETYGIEAGDHIIIEISKRLKLLNKNLPDLAYVSRFSGDEFLLFFQDIGSLKNLEAEITSIIKNISVPYQYNDQTIFLRFVLGASFCELCYADLDFHLSAASNARSIAKSEKRDYYIAGKDDDIVARIKEKKDLENDLHQAIENNYFEVYFQPIYSLTEKKYCGIEALLRYNHPEKGQISPVEFIPIAEGMGIIDKIGLFVLEESAKQAVRLEKVGISSKEIHVNISPDHFNRPEFVDDVRTILSRYKLSSHKICIEITEEVALLNLEDQKQKIEALKKAGVSISIDDFGTGYSSFLYLNQLNVDQIKIDKSFVLNMVNNKKDYEIVKTITKLANSLSIDLVAEGVENSEIINILSEMGVPKLQGYHFSRPVPADQLTDILLQYEGQ